MYVPCKAVESIVYLKIPSLEMEQIPKYRIHNSLEMDMMMSNMFEARKGIFLNVAQEKPRDWSHT